MLARLLIIASVLVLCSCSPQPPNAVSRVDTEPVDAASGPNIASTRWDVWSVTCLIDARAYRPGEPIRITVTFTSDAERELPVVALRCVLLDSANNIIRTADRDLRLVAFHFPSFHLLSQCKDAYSVQVLPNAIHILPSPCDIDVREREEA